MKARLFLLLSTFLSVLAQPSWFVSNTCPPGNAVCDRLLEAYQNKQSITVTETLTNPFSIVQFDGSGEIVFVGHPTGIEIETVFNPFALGAQPPDANFPYTDAVGQNMGVCHSLASLPPTNATADVCGQNLCNLNFVFYADNSVVAECMPPGSNCHSLDRYRVIGQVSYQGLFGSCASQPFYSKMPITGGSGIFSGAQGYVLALQIPSYEYFTYTITFAR